MLEQINDNIARTFYELSSVLLFPVLLAVLVLLLLTLMLVGGALREMIDRKRTRTALHEAVNIADKGAPGVHAAVLEALKTAPSGLPRRFARSISRHKRTSMAWNKALTNLESDIAIGLGRIGFLSRLGPMLGLLGTLIPFGPALAGLSSGDVQALSANLVTAFATTVIGLLCGSVALAVGSIRRGWYTRDFDDLEHIVETLAEAAPHEESQTEKMAGHGRRPDLRVDQLV